MTGDYPQSSDECGLASIRPSERGRSTAFLLIGWVIRVLLLRDPGSWDALFGSGKRGLLSSGDPASVDAPRRSSLSGDLLPIRAVGLGGVHTLTRSKCQKASTWSVLVLMIGANSTPRIRRLLCTWLARSLLPTLGGADFRSVVRGLGACPRQEPTPRLTRGDGG